MSDLPYALSQADTGDVNPEYVMHLEKALQECWCLGRNIILAWSPEPKGITILAIPHYALNEYVAEGRATGQTDPSTGLIQDEIGGVVSGYKLVSLADLNKMAGLLGFEVETIDLPFAPGSDLPYQSIEDLIKRFGISYVEDRAVALFDIVGFSLLTPLEQVTQLNSLSYSLNYSYSKLLEKKIDISFARTTTGDGFYIWNRDRSIQANVNLYHFMHLVFADNAISGSKSSHNTTPVLRACFHVGGHYEFYQSEGLSPTVYSYIVGDVTIELARMINRALPGQVLLGDFKIPVFDQVSEQIVKIDTIQFIEKAQETLSSLQGLELSGEAIDSIKCYLTGDKMESNEFGIYCYEINDKHGKTRGVYNAKINIYRGDAAPLFIGLQTSDLTDFEVSSIDFVIPEDDEALKLA